MTRLALVLCLLAAAYCGCGCRVTAQAPYLHGRTEPPTAGVVVAVSAGGAPRYTPPTGANGFWGVTPWVGLHTITVTAPIGWRVVRITHPVLGSATGNVLKANITSSTDLRADVVVWLAQVATPTPQSTAVTPTRVPSATATPLPTMPMPPPQGTAVAPPLPTPRPRPTPPPGGWEPWEPDAALVNALAWELEWRLGVYAETDDPLWLAASSRGPVWPMMLPEAQHYDVEMPDGSSVETVLRWQAFVTPKGWRMVMSRAESPYQVAIVEGEGW